MDTKFLRAVLTAPDDHPRWEVDLLAQLAKVSCPGPRSAPGEAELELAMRNVAAEDLRRR